MASRSVRFVRPFVALLLVSLAVLSWTQPALASPIEVVGALNNFDVYNRTGDSCDGFEIELHGIDVSDVYHTYRNPAWGSPQITALPGPTPGVRVVYDGRTAGQRVTPDLIQHFGVSLRRQADRVVYNWLTNSGGTLVLAPVTPTPDPTSLPTLPTPTWAEEGGQLVTEIRNTNDYPIWLKARRSSNDDVVELEDLLRDNALMSGLVDSTDATEAFLLDPGDALTEAEDLIEASGPGGRAVFRVFQYTGPVDDSNNALGDLDFTTMSGDEVGTVMVAVNLVPEPATVASVSGIALILRRARRRP